MSLSKHACVNMNGSSVWRSWARVAAASSACGVREWQRMHGMNGRAHIRLLYRGVRMAAVFWVASAMMYSAASRLISKRPSSSPASSPCPRSSCCPSSSSPSSSPRPSSSSPSSSPRPPSACPLLSSSSSSSRSLILMCYRLP